VQEQSLKRVQPSKAKSEEEMGQKSHDYTSNPAATARTEQLRLAIGHICSTDLSRDVKLQILAGAERNITREISGADGMGCTS
jgi:hypothetical protein